MQAAELIQPSRPRPRQANPDVRTEDTIHRIPRPRRWRPRGLTIASAPPAAARVTTP